MLTFPSSITMCFVALMAILFLIDLLTSFSKHHRDFRSIIVSVGVLGTFVGIFLGLQGFNSNDIQGSVPVLLDGLKIAFLTSVVGMGLSVVLAIFNRLRSSQSSDDEVNALNQISAKLDKLDQLESLDQLQTLSAIRDDIFQSQRQLDQHFANTNQTITAALDTLSRSASEEIVKSLETVITNFNNNLTEQFGDNFKQLNSGVSNLLEWQNSYRDSVTNNTQLLNTISQSLSQSKDTLEAVATRNSETMQVYENLSSMINSQQEQSQMLKQQMQEFSVLSNQASKAFSTMQTGFTGVQAGMQVQSEAMAQLTADISRQLPESMRELENTLSGLTNKFARDYQSFLERYRLLLADEE